MGERVLVPARLERGYDVTVLDTFARGGTELAACARCSLRGMS